MRISVIAVGSRMPAWVKMGFADYAQRLPRECHIALIEINVKKFTKNLFGQQLTREEGKRMLAAVRPGSRIIALDVTGQLWDSEQLAGHLSHWLGGGREVALLIGGAEGLPEICRRQAELTWSLSRLTFPHMLVRVIVVEQLYRAWSILKKHPYHRA